MGLNNLLQSKQLNKKTAVAVLLSVAFMWVMVSKFLTPSESPNLDTTQTADSYTSFRAEPNKSALTNTAQKEASSEEKQPRKSCLPDIDLQRILTQNPFAASGTTQVDRPSSGNAAESNPKDQPTQEIASQNDQIQPRVEAVVTGRGRPVALINDKFYFEQDIVDGRWRIEKIRPQEVLFSME